MSNSKEISAEELAFEATQCGATIEVANAVYDAHVTALEDAIEASFQAKLADEIANLR